MTTTPPGPPPPSRLVLLEDVKRAKSRLGGRVDELIQHVREPEWAASPTAQLETIRMLRLGVAGGRPIPVDTWNRLNMEARLVFSRLPNQSARRWDRILQLPDDEDVARALRWQPANSTRFHGEAVYPTDGWIGTYLRWCQEGEVPLAYHFWSAVAAVGAACHRNVFLDRGSFYLYPAHSVLLIGPPGVRKTQAVGTAVGVLEVANRHLTTRWQERMRADPTGLHDVDPRVRMLPHDASFLHIIKSLRGPKVVWVGEEQVTLTAEGPACGFLGLDELGTLLSKDGFAVGKTVDTLIALCDAPKQYRYSTERQGLLVLNNVAMTFLAATTPAWVRDNLTSRMFLGGFASRILFIHRVNAGGRRYATPAPLDPVAREELGGWLADLCEGEAMPMELAPDTTRSFELWYEDNHRLHVDVEEPDERLGGYYRRKDGHVLRLAMVLALANGEAPVVSQLRFDQALAVMEHEEQHMLTCFSEVGRHPDAPVLNIILGTLRKYGGELAYSDWLRRCHHYEGVGRRFGEFVDTLVAMNLVRLRAPGAGARHNAARVYQVVPQRGATAPGLPVTPVDLGE